MKTLEERLKGILYESIFVKRNGIPDRKLEHNLYIDENNILVFIKKEIESLRDEVVGEDLEGGLRLDTFKEGFKEGKRKERQRVINIFNQYLGK